MPRTSCRNRRNFASWRIDLLFVVILASAGFCKSERSIGNFQVRPTSMGFSNPPRKSLPQEIGSPSELAWQAWLLVDSQKGNYPGMDSASLIRRITPKSIFIAPPICSDNGSSENGKKCGLKDINIDPEAHQQYLTAQLNAMYGKGGSREGLLGALNRRKPESASGPLQFNIPLIQSDPSPYKIDLEKSTNPPEPVSQPPPLPEIKDENVASMFNAPIGTRFEVNFNKRKESGNHRDQPAFVIESTIPQQFKQDNVQKPFFTHQKLPVAVIPADSNDSFIGVVDYKIPEHSKPIVNHTSYQNKRPVEAANSHKDFFPDKTTQRPNTVTLPPTLVLLVTPPKVQAVSTTESSTESEVVRNSSLDPTTERGPIKNQDENATEDANITDEFYIPTVTSLDDFNTYSTDETVNTEDDNSNSDLDYTQHSNTDNDKHDDVSAYGDEESNFEPNDDRDEYDETTDNIDQEDFVDPDDEILKPGEAGMTIPKENQEMVQSNKHNRQNQLNQSKNATWQTSTMATDATTLYVTLNADSNVTTIEDDYDRASTTDSFEEFTNADISEHTITDDSSTETVLPYTSTADSTKTPIIVNSTSISNYSTFTDSQDDLNKALKDTLTLEKDFDAEPEIILSTKGNDETSSPSNLDEKRNDELVTGTATPSSKESIYENTERTTSQTISFFSREPPLWIRQKVTTQVDEDRQASTMDERVIPPNFGAVIREYPRPTLPNHRRDQDFVRFPSDERPQQSYVKFPSDEVNSIHNQDYKERLPYRWNDYSSPTTSAKTIASNRHKQVRWRLPSSRSGIEYEASHQIDSLTGTQNKQRQKPSHLRFWPRLSLSDMNFFTTTSHGSHNEPIGGQPTKTNYYSEVSSRDIDRLLAQTIGG